MEDEKIPFFALWKNWTPRDGWERKADLFSKRAIQHRQPVTSVDTAVEALAVSIGEKACVDLGFMASLMGGAEKIPQIVEDLKGVIFKDPTTGPFDIETGGANWYRGWQTADEYLSGDVRRNSDFFETAEFLCKFFHWCQNSTYLHKKFRGLDFLSG